MSIATAPEAAEQLLTFWFAETARAQWFKKDADFDRALGSRYGAPLEAAKRGELDDWAGTPRGALALIILLDQFSRNIYRGRPAAFEADPLARKHTLGSIGAGFDLAVPAEQRLFFYMPLMHAEDLALQELCLEKVQALAREGHDLEHYARAHMAIIERFGRFPHRNEILGRASTAEEDAFLREPNSGF